MPCTDNLPVKEPRRPFLIMSPVFSTEVGSPTMHQSKTCWRDFKASQTTTVPSTEGPSSSLVNRKARLSEVSGWAAKKSSVATTMAAKEVFMSLAPRPYKRPSRWLGVKGSLDQLARGPVGTTSVCPAHTKVRLRGWVLGRSAHKLVTRKLSGPLAMVSHTNPRGSSRWAIRL